MTATLFILCAVSSIMRRATLTSQWERAATCAVMLLGLGVALMAIPEQLVTYLSVEVPWAGVVRMLGHMCLLCAAAAIAIAAVTRIEGVTRSTVNTGVATLMLAIIIYGQLIQPGARIACLSAYMFTLSCGLVYLLGYSILGLFVLVGDERQRRTALMYAAACVSGLLAYAAPWVLRWIIPVEAREAWELVIQLLVLLWVGGFAAAASYSWWSKMRVFRGLRMALQAANNG